MEVPPCDMYALAHNMDKAFVLLRSLIWPSAADGAFDYYASMYAERPSNVSWHKHTHPVRCSQGTFSNSSFPRKSTCTPSRTRAS